jgi:type IV fimbrial biogenesis protein FimT
MSKLRPSHGFTLVELLVVVSITGILLMVAIPSLRAIVERNAVASNVNSFVGSVNQARSEAIKRSGTVTMCRSTAPEAASPACASATDWATGWIVFLDRNGNGAIDGTDGDLLIRVQGAVTNSGGIVQSAAGNLVFRSTGLMTSGASNFTFSSRSGATDQARSVCVTLQGRTRTTATSSESC